MPLVWDLTAELKRWLTPEKLRELNKGWIQQGGGHSFGVIDDLTSMLARPDAHYESVLGYLETQFRRHGRRETQRAYHELYSWLIEMVYHLLYFRHVNNVLYIERAVTHLDGIAHLAANNSPLWVFTLNHDLIPECVAAKHGLKLSCGFSSEVVTLPRRNALGVKTGDLRAEVITGKQLETAAMSFLPWGSSGINLLKIHGGLDQFTFREGQDLLRVLPDEMSVAGVLQSLRVANEELLFYAAEHARKVKASNEIAYADDDGEMQFLRRCLLSGAFKFDVHRDQVLPKRMLEHFRSNINHVSHLICIGYGFGDEHVNRILRGWLEFTADRRIEIVGPGVKSIPAFLLHVAPQVVLVDATATDYLDRCAGIVRSRAETVGKRFSAWARSRAKEDVQKEFGEFMRERRDALALAFVEKVKSLPKRDDGDLDLSATGITPEEFATKLIAEAGGLDAHDTMEAFLDSRDKSSGSP